MNKIIKYLKIISIFIIVELFISLIASILNMLNVDYGITEIFLLVTNIIIFLYLGYISNKNNQKKNILIGIILLIIMVMLKLIFIRTSYTLTTFIYYIILLISSIIGSKLPKKKQ